MSRQLLLIAPFSLGYARAMTLGVGRFVQHTPGWQVRLMENPDVPIRVLNRFQAAVAYIATDANYDILRKLRIPVVNVSNRLPLPKVFPRVGIDEQAVGRMAAEHFLERGFRQFAAAGMAGHVYSAQRMEGYRRTLASRGFDCAELDPVVDFNNTTQSIAARLASLPRRTAVYCCNDTRAQHVIAAAEQIGRRVPEDLAVLGTDNDELTCLLIAPTLSSVMISGERIGQSAAELAARLADGHAPPRAPVLIPPSGIAERESTDVVAPTDPAVALAMRMLAERFAEPIDADELVRGTAMSRRSLERRFRETLGYGIFETLRQIRVRQARHLLVSTDIPLKEIAVRCGFSDQYRFSTVFRQMTGKSPGAYRRENRV